MKGLIFLTCVVVGSISGAPVRADEPKKMSHGDHQPSWHSFARRDKCHTPEEERLQLFWHDYYDSLRRYYAALDHIDWADYFKKKGYKIEKMPCGPGGCKRSASHRCLPARECGGHCRTAS